VLIIDCSKTFNQMPPALNSPRTMSVNWKAGVPFKTFTAYREEYHNSTDFAARKASRLKCSKYSTEKSCLTKKSSQDTIGSHSC
jgi:hypothetical protein